MKFPQINSLVPEGQHFDESALNEGIWISVDHLNKIESHLALNVSNISSLNGEITNLKTKATEDATAVNTANTTISGLQTKMLDVIAERDEWKGKAEKYGAMSGRGTTVAVTADVIPDASQKELSYASDESPINKWLDQRMKYKK